MAKFTSENKYAKIGDFDATIHWGDGSTSAGNIVVDPGRSTWDVVGSHFYGQFKGVGSNPVRPTDCNDVRD
jgi:hypothetical protein